MAITARGSDPDVVGAAVIAAFEAIGQVERLMSFHDPASELSRINREAHRAPCHIHPWTYAVLSRAQRLAALTDGMFDVSVAPMLVDAGHLPGHPGEVPAPAAWRGLRLLPDGSVRFDRPMWLDLGGIAKGFAVDMAIHALRSGGCEDATVNAGGDLRRFGAVAEVVHLRRADGLVPMAELRCGAIATSGPYEIDSQRLAQPIGHIADPKQRRFWTGSGSVTVAARTCVIADAFTKVAALVGPACKPMLARYGAQARWDAAA